MASLTTFDEVIDTLRLIIARNGMATICMTKLNFKDADVQNMQKLESEEFFSAMLKSKLFLSKHEISCLLRHYKLDEVYLDYVKFIEDIQLPLVDSRLEISHKLFDALKDHAQDAWILKSKLVSTFKAEAHPMVVAGQLSAGNVHDMFVKAWTRSQDENGKIDKQTFLDYMKGVSSAYPYNDTKFISIVNECWKEQLSQEKDDQVSKSEQASLLYCVQSQSMLADKVRQKMKDGTNEKMTLSKTFQHFDAKNTGFVSFNEFIKVLERYGVLMPNQEAQMLYNQFPQNENSKIKYAEFVKQLFEHNSF